MITTLVLSLALTVQDKPVDIPKAQLPKAAECVVCSANGAGHEEEKPAAGVTYKGKPYYFCNAKEVAEFKKDPESWIPLPLPRAMAKFDLVDLGGKTWSADAFKDRVVLIDFWATWCVPCRKVRPMVAELGKKHQSMSVLSVSIDERRADLDKFLKKEEFDGPVLHDNKQVWAAWRVRAIPALFLVKNGQVVAQWTGVPDKKELAAAVEAAVQKETAPLSSAPR
jgi:thiol-disulfide isomerase/thioredoxin